MNSSATTTHPAQQPSGPAGGWWVPRPTMRWAPISHVATAALIGSGTLQDRYQIAAVVLLTITAQICDTIRTVHSRRPAS